MKDVITVRRGHREYDSDPQIIEATATVHFGDATVHEMRVSAMLGPEVPEVDAQVRTLDSGAKVLELVDEEGKVWACELHEQPARGGAWESGPTVQTIPSGAWTKVVDAELEVLHQAAAAAEFVVDDGEVSSSVPFKVRSAPEPDYDSWGRDA